METVTVTGLELPCCLVPSSAGGPPSIHSPAIPSPGQPEPHAGTGGMNEREGPKDARHFFLNQLPHC